MDREKVIKGLQAHADGCGYRSHHCDAMECPYRYGDKSCDIEEMCRDALALLKEQEDLGTELTNAVELIHKKNERIEKLLKEQKEKKRFLVTETGRWIPLDRITMLQPNGYIESENGHIEKPASSALEAVVYCKDCKHYDKTDCSDGFGWCNRNGEGCGRTDDWFCADGRMKE